MSEQQAMTLDPRDRIGSADEFKIAHVRCVLQYLATRMTLPCNVCLTFSYPSLLKPILLRAFLESNFPEMLSKVGVLDGRGMKKSKKHCTGASPESPTTVKHT